MNDFAVCLSVMLFLTFLLVTTSPVVLAMETVVLFIGFFVIDVILELE